MQKDVLYKLRLHFRHLLVSVLIGFSAINEIIILL